MPRVLWLNLDAAWPFAALVQNHCLDLMPGDHTWVWNLAEEGREPLGPWPDWPLAVPVARLLDTVDDLPRPGPLGQVPLVLVHLPGDAGRGSPVDDVIAGLQERVSQARLDLVLTLPPGGELDPVQALAPSALMVVRLCDAAPLRRLHAERLLIEWLEHPTLGEELRSYPRPAVMELSLTGARRETPLDRVAADWGAGLPGIMDQIEPLLAGAGGIGAGDSRPSQLLTSAFDGVDKLSQGAGEAQTLPRSEPLGDAGLRAPLFFSRDMDDLLAKRRADVLESLEAHLSERYRELRIGHQGVASRAAHRESELVRGLSGLTPIQVGLGRAGVTWIEDQRQACARKESDVLAEARRILHDLERDLRPGEPRPCGDYLRQRFLEDESFDKAVIAARDRAGHLPRLRHLALAWGAVTLIALSPVVAARLPGWRNQGLLPYASDPSLWVPDVAWTLLPGCLVVVGTLYLATRRRRALAVALAGVENSAENLWRRHASVLANTFHYARQVFAMRWLQVVREQLDRLARTVHDSRAGLEALARALTRQHAHYREIGALDTPAGGAVAIPRLEPAMAPGTSPRDWVCAMIEDLPVPTGQALQAWDHRKNNFAELSSRYLRGYDRADLREARPEPPSP